MVFVLSGCGSLKTKGEQTVEKAMELHDTQYQAGVVLVKGSPVRTVFEAEGHSPERMWAVLVLSGYDDETVDLVNYLVSSGQLVIKGSMHPVPVQYEMR